MRTENTIPTDHPDDLRADGEGILPEWLEDRANQSDLVWAIHMLPELRADLGQGCIHAGEFDLIPFRTQRQIKRRIGGPLTVDVVGWIAMEGVVSSGGHWEPDDYDEVELFRTDGDLRCAVRRLCVLRLERELDYSACGSDCSKCDGIGVDDPLADSPTACAACEGTGLSVSTRLMLAKFHNEEVEVEK